MVHALTAEIKQTAERFGMGYDEKTGAVLIVGENGGKAIDTDNIKEVMDQWQEDRL